jgi:hypothetical protein
MTAYSFKPRFVEPILTLRKHQTIRAPRLGRSRHVRPGEQIQLYAGMRTKQCRLIGVATCTAVTPITLDFINHSFAIGAGQWTTYARRNEFARRDGFDTWQEMEHFWQVEHDGMKMFTGVLIEWDPQSLRSRA